MVILLEWARAAIPLLAALLLPFWLVRSGVRWLLQHWSDRGGKAWGWVSGLANLALAGVLVREAVRLGDPFWLYCAAVPCLVAALGLSRLLSGRPKPRREAPPSVPLSANSSYSSISIRLDD